MAFPASLPNRQVYTIAGKFSEVQLKMKVLPAFTKTKTGFPVAWMALIKPTLRIRIIKSSLMIFF